MRQLIARLRAQKQQQKRAVSQAKRQQQEAVKRYQQRQGNKVAELLAAATQKAQDNAEAQCKASSEVSVNRTSPFACCLITSLHTA